MLITKFTHIFNIFVRSSTKRRKTNVGWLHLLDFFSACLEFLFASLPNSQSITLLFFIACRCYTLCNILLSMLPYHLRCIMLVVLLLLSIKYFILSHIPCLCGILIMYYPSSPPLQHFIDGPSAIRCLSVSLAYLQLN